MKRLCVLLMALLVFAPRLAAAQATRFSVVNYRPTTDRAEFQVVRQSRNLFQLQWHAGTQTVFGYRILEERQTPRKLLDRLLLQHFYGGVGLTDWLSVGLDLPVALNAHFQDPGPVIAPGFQNKFRLADPRLEFKASVVNRYRSPVGFAVAPYITLPFGKAAQFLGDETVSGGGLLIADAEFWRRLVLSLNLGAEGRRPVNFRNIQISTASLLYGLGAAVRVTPKADLSVEITGRTPMKRLFTERAESPAEVVVGGHLQVGKSGLAVSAGGGAGLVHGAGAPMVRAFAGLSYQATNPKFTAKQEALERMKYVTLKGASPVQWNIVELRATCPANAATYNPEVHDPGCPKYYALREVAALLTTCPVRPEDFNPAKHDANCPKVYELREAMTAADWKTVNVLARADADDDGVSDLDDRCPTVAGVVTGRGCPEKEVLVTGGVLQPKVPIQFGFNSAQLDSAAMAALDEVALTLQQHPEIERVRVKGYTDSIGSPRVNLWISRARAGVVRNYLWSRGIAHRRVRAVGLGEAHPVAPNTTPEGRALNRRAIFLVIEK